MKKLKVKGKVRIISRDELITLMDFEEAVTYFSFSNRELVRLHNEDVGKEEFKVRTHPILGEYIAYV